MKPDMLTNEVKPEQITRYTKKGLFYGLVSLLLITILVVVLYLTVAHSYIGNTFNNIDLVLLCFGWLNMVVAILVLGYRWKALLPQHDSVSGHFLGMCLAGALLLNYAVPGPFGEFAAAWFLHRKSSVSLPLGLASIAVGRIIGLACAAFGATMCWFFFTPSSKEEVRWLIHSLVIAILIGFVLLLALFTLPTKLLPFFTGKWGKLGEIIEQLLQAISETTSLHQHSYAKAVLWSVLGHFFAALGVWFSLLSIGEPASIVGVVFSYLSSTCCGVIAFLFPGSQVAWDAIFAGLLVSTADYNLADATTAVVLLRAEQIALMLSGAIPLLWLLRRDRRKASTDK
jgi:uncharacterized membrane protein YbhN (UPF0104 family)